MPAMEAVERIEPPPRASRCGQAALAHRKTLLRFVSSSWSHCSSLSSTTEPTIVTPALQTSDVEPAELGHGRGDRALDRRAARDVDAEAERTAAELLRRCARPVRPQVGERHARALGCEARGGLAADPRGGARDERQLALQPHAAPFVRPMDLTARIGPDRAARVKDP